MWVVCSPPCGNNETRLQIKIDPWIDQNRPWISNEIHNSHKKSVGVEPIAQSTCENGKWCPIQAWTRNIWWNMVKNSLETSKISPGKQSQPALVCTALSMGGTRKNTNRWDKKNGHGQVTSNNAVTTGFMSLSILDRIGWSPCYTNPNQLPHLDRISKHYKNLKVLSVYTYCSCSIFSKARL